MCRLIKRYFELDVDVNVFLHDCCDSYPRSELQDDVLDEGDEYVVFDKNDPYVSCQN